MEASLSSHLPVPQSSTGLATSRVISTYLGVVVVVCCLLVIVEPYSRRRAHLHFQSQSQLCDLVATIKELWILLEHTGNYNFKLFSIDALTKIMMSMRQTERV